MMTQEGMLVIERKLWSYLWLLALSGLLWSCSAQAALPLPTDIASGPAGAASPGGKGLPAMSGAAPAGAPAISAVSDVTYPDETLVITGEGLDGAALRAWAEGKAFDIKPLRTGKDRMQAVVPKDAPLSTMLIWPVKGDKAGVPIRVNGATVWWSWPARVEAGARGATARVFGKNLRLPAGPQPQLVLVGEGGKGRQLKMVSANPYQLEGELPGDLKPGKYRLQAHNGTGGIWGWSEAASFEVVEPLKIPAEVFKVEDYRKEGGSDREAVLAAVAAAVKNSGGTVLFAAREYRDIVGVTLDKGRVVKDSIVLPEGAPIIIKGAGMGGYDWHKAPGAITGRGSLIASASTHSRYPVFELLGRGQRVEDMTIIVNGEAAGGGPDIEQRISGINLKGPDQKVLRTRLVRSQHCTHWLVNSIYRGVANHEIIGCEFYHAAMGMRIMPGTNFVRLSGNIMRGHYAQGRSTDANSINCNGNNIIVEKCDFAGLDKTGGRIMGRTFLSGNGYTSFAYLAGNRSVNVGSHSSVPGIDANTSEQYLFHVGDRDGGMFTVVRGSSDGLKLEEKGAGILTGSIVTQPWTTTMDREGKPKDGDWTVFVASGRGVGQWRLVDRAASSGADIKVTRPWRLVPDTSSSVIMQRVFHNNIIYDNYLDPNPDPSKTENHKTVGVFWWNNCFENVTAANVMKNIGVGVAVTIFSGTGRGDVASVWNLTRDNRFSNMVGGVGDAAPGPTFYSDHHIGNGWAGQKEDFDGWRTVGNIFRANTGQGSADSLAHHGWMRFEQIKSLDKINYVPGPDKGMVMSVMENNVLLGGKRGILLSAPSNWTLLRNNRTQVLDPAEAEIEFFGQDKVVDLLVIKAQ